jgi:hypothetical protein
MAQQVIINTETTTGTIRDPEQLVLAGVYEAGHYAPGAFLSVMELETDPLPDCVAAACETAPGR